MASLRLNARPVVIVVTSLALLAALDSDGPRRIDGADPRIRYEGRVVADHDGRVRFAWPRVAMHLRFRGTRLDALLCDTRLHPSGRDTDALGVQIDRGPMRRITLHAGVFDYPLAEGLTPGVHTLRVLKLTEGEVGTVRVDGLSVPGGVLLQAPAAPRRRMLAIGDSITAGYGVNGRDARCGYDPAYNDASRAWVSLAADALGAELHVVAWSGRGLVHNYNPDARETLVDLFARAIPTEPDAHDDPRAWVPDVVVLNVGTNDAAASGFDATLYRDALDSFVQRLRALYPRARFVLAVGPLLSDYYPPDCHALTWVRDATVAVVAAERARGHPNVSLLDLPEATPDEGCGCASHPSASTHERMARQLVAALRAP